MGNGDWYRKDAGKILSELKTSENGLSESEARKRLLRFGPNLLKEKKGFSKIKLLLSQFRSLLVIILIIAVIISVLIGHAVDAIVILIIVIFNAVFGFFQEYKAEKAMQALKKLTSPVARVIRHGSVKEIPARNLVPGDIIILSEGDKVPADARVIESVSLRIDESSLTGESVTVSKSIDAIAKESPISERKNMAWLGTVVTYGRGKAVIISTGMATEMGKIAKEIQVEEEETPLQGRLSTFGKQMGIIILVICAIVTIVGIMRGSEPLGMFITGIALAVAAIPEGLPAVLTITLALGMQRMAKKRAIVRRLPAVETLGCATIICSDKTGTLTKNEMTVERIYYSGKMIEVTGTGYEPEGSFLLNKKKISPLKDFGLSMLLKTSALCNNASLSQDRKGIIGDPTEGALLVAAEKAGFNQEKLKKQNLNALEIPFSSERKMMTTLHKIQGGYTAFIKGAPEVLLDLCTHTIEDSRKKPLTPMKKKKILDANNRMGEDALRVLAFAYREFRSRPEETGIEKNLVFLGMAGMIDPPREEVKHSIKICGDAGIKTVMVTGDNQVTAAAIAKQLGMFREGDKILTGLELEKLPQKELEKDVESIRIYARVSPIHKVRILDALRKNGHIVAMTGDGVNDAPALKRADIGIAMGIKGTDVAKEASDMILEDDNFSTIVVAVEEGRAIFDNIRKFIQYLLSSNLGEVLVIFIAMLIGFTDPATGAFILPLTAVQLLWINLLTDGPPALALGMDPPSPGIMKRKPRNTKENILSRDMLADILIIGIVICIGTLFIFSINLSEGVPKAMTAAFTIIVMFEMVRIQSVRMKYKIGLFSNMKLIYAMIISISMQVLVVYVPFLQQAFGTVALGLLDWIEIILVSSTILIVMWIKQRIRG